MSDATFSAPTAPTEGLAPYNLERKVVSTVPGPAMGRLARLLSPMRRRLKAGRAPVNPLTKDFDNVYISRDAVKAMTGTLLTSVTGAMDLPADERTAFLTKTFGEYDAEMGKALGVADAAVSAALSKRAPEAEVPLYKGLGTVGRVADLVGHLARKIEAIKQGVDYPGQTPDGGVDVPSEPIADMLDHILAAGELTLHACVNEHVAPLLDGEDEDDLPQGMHLIMVPNADFPDDEDAAMVVKTVLPEDLAKFAIDPAYIAEGVIELGAGLMLEGGVTEQQLTKVFQPKTMHAGMHAGMHGLAKAAGAVAAKKPGTPGTPDPNAANEDDQADQGGDDQMQANGQDDDGQDPLDVLGRLLAAAMIQLDHIQQMVEGDAGQDPADAGANVAAAGDEAAGGGGDVAKSVRTGALHKGDFGGVLAENEELKKRLDALAPLQEVVGQPGFVDMLTKFAAQPQLAKGAIKAVAIERTADTSSVVQDQQNEVEALNKMAPEERGVALIKRAQQGLPPLAGVAAGAQAGVPGMVTRTAMA